MRVNVKYFASIREALGRGGEAVETSAVTCAALRDELLARGEPYATALARGKSVRLALDQLMSDESAPLRDGCDLAFFPPVTGG